MSAEEAIEYANCTSVEDKTPPPMGPLMLEDRMLVAEYVIQMPKWSCDPQHSTLVLTWAR